MGLSDVCQFFVLNAALADAETYKGGMDMAEPKDGIAGEVISETAEEKTEAAPVHTGAPEQEKAQKSTPAKKEKESAAPKEEKTQEGAAPGVEKAKKGASKKSSAKAAAAPKQEAQVQKNISKVKSAVLAGANPNVEFYQISDDLPVYLL